eukprot:scaffold34990_cov66-Phaeocystis_antarctica.AAC.4
MPNSGARADAWLEVGRRGASTAVVKRGTLPHARPDGGALLPTGRGTRGPAAGRCAARALHALGVLWARGLKHLAKLASPASVGGRWDGLRGWWWRLEKGAE